MGTFDANTQFCIDWFKTHIYKEGGYGDADTIARGRNASLDDLVHTGVIVSHAGKVNLIKRENIGTKILSDDCTWKSTQNIVHTLRIAGIADVEGIYELIGSTKMERCHTLAYTMYTICADAGYTEEARAYNELITTWSDIIRHIAKKTAIEN
jgi:putative DNA methylase